jgi:hypothetical protein
VADAIQKKEFEKAMDSRGAEFHLNFEAFTSTIGKGLDRVPEEKV